MAKKDHDLLDVKAAVLNGIKWELGRFARRMTETAMSVVDAEMQKAVTKGTAINALEIAEVAVNAAKAQFGADVRPAINSAPVRRRIAKG